MSIVAKLGEGGKWHRVVARAANEEYTACSIVLKPIKSSIHTSAVAIKIGEPTCRHCVRKEKRA